MIILLNGTSSAGKSTILQEFKKLHPDYILFKMDDYWPDELEKKAGAFGWRKDSGIDSWLFLLDYAVEKTGQHLLSTQTRSMLFTETPPYYDGVKKMVDNDSSVIIDTVLEFESEYQAFFHFFKDYKMYKILVYCPLNILLQRVEARNTMGLESEMRYAFTAFEQFPALYKIQERFDEQIVGIVETQVMKDALNQAIQELINKNIPDAYVPVIEEFKQEFIQQFKLNEHKKITLVPRHRYDLIITTAHQTPDECAKLIHQSL